MNCKSCLNLQESGLCGVYGKEPPEGFAARCLRYASRSVESGVRSEEFESPALRAESSNSTLHTPHSTLNKRLCLAEYCPFLVTELPGTYCMARILPDRTEYLALEEETPCPRDWTI